MIRTFLNFKLLVFITFCLLVLLKVLEVEKCFEIEEFIISTSTKFLSSFPRVSGL